MFHIMSLEGFQCSSGNLFSPSSTDEPLLNTHLDLRDHLGHLANLCQNLLQPLPKCGPQTRSIGISASLPEMQNLGTYPKPTRLASAFSSPHSPVFHLPIVLSKLSTYFLQYFLDHAVHVSHLRGTQPKMHIRIT